MGFSGGSVVKNPPARQEMQEIQVQFLGQEDPLEEDMATHFSIPAGKFPGQRSLAGYCSQGRRVARDWNTWACTHTYRRENKLYYFCIWEKLLLKIQDGNITFPFSSGYIVVRGGEWGRFFLGLSQHPVPISGIFIHIRGSLEGVQSMIQGRLVCEIPYLLKAPIEAEGGGINGESVVTFLRVEGSLAYFFRRKSSNPSLL